jgi:hypothetical protein
LFGKKKSSSSMQPWSPAQKPLKAILGQARNLHQSGGFRTDPYMGERVSPYSAMTMGGIDMLGQMQGQTPGMRSTMDSMVADGGGQYNSARYGSQALNEMLDGGGMYRDFDTIRKTVGDQTQARLAGVFAGGGINSSLAQDTYARGLGEALAGVEYGAWGDQQNRRLAALGIDASGFENDQNRRMSSFDNAQGRRLSAMGMAPAMQGMDMRAAGARLTGGGLMDDRNQRVIDANMARHYEMEDADMNALMRYSGLVQGIGGMGGQSSQTTPTSMTDWGNMFSGLGSGLSAAATLFGNQPAAPTSSPRPMPRP